MSKMEIFTAQENELLKQCKETLPKNLTHIYNQDTKMGIKSCVLFKKIYTLDKSG